MMSTAGATIACLTSKEGVIKCIDLTAEKEPDIFAAIKKGALLENITFKKQAVMKLIMRMAV